MSTILSFQPCNSQQVQTRKRTVLRAPDRYKKNNYPCPALIEERNCIKRIVCKESVWRVSEWSSCLVKDGEVPWGIGKRERYVMCTDYYGNPQRSHHCYEVNIWILFIFKICFSLVVSSIRNNSDWKYTKCIKKKKKLILSLNFCIEELFNFMILNTFCGFVFYFILFYKNNHLRICFQILRLFKWNNFIVE